MVDSQDAIQYSAASTDEKVITGVIEATENRNKHYFLGRIQIKTDDGELCTLENAAAFGTVRDYLAPGFHGTFYIRNGADGCLIAGIKREDGIKLYDETHRAEAIDLHKQARALHAMKGAGIGVVGGFMFTAIADALLNEQAFWSFSVYAMGAVIIAAVGGYHFSEAPRRVLALIDPPGVKQFLKDNGFTTNTQ